MKNKKINIAILSHGLIGRSLSHTVDSFRKNVLGSLNKVGNVDVFYHSWHTDNISNIRTGEKKMINSDLISELLPEAHGIIENQDEFDKSINWEKHKKNNPFAISVKIPSERETMSTLKNHKRALMSQKKSYEFFKDNKTKNYDIVIVARLDVKYPEKIKIPKIEDINKAKENMEKVIWIPDFDHLKGLNDRFAAGDEDAIKMWSDRVDFSDKWTLNYNKGENSEWLMKEWIKKNNYDVKYLNFVFQRVRAGGEIHKMDKIFLRSYCFNKLSYPLRAIHFLLWKIKLSIKGRIVK